MISERLYRALLVFYPAGHRRDYEEPMVQLFRDRMRRDGGGFRTPVVWVRMVFDLLGSAFMEHRERATWESATVKRAAVRSGEFLLWSLVGAIGLYMITTLAVVVASIVSLKTGLYPFTIETGFGVTQDAPREFWVMYRPDNTLVLLDRTKMAIKFDLIQILVLVAAAGLLIGAALAMRALRTSLKS